MKQTAANLGILLTVVSAFFFIGFAIYASVYRYGNPKLTETELQIWALMNWWRWVLPMAGLGGGYWLLYWAARK
jgi:hypothetical protein